MTNRNKLTYKCLAIFIMIAIVVVSTFVITKIIPVTKAVVAF